MWSLGLRKLLAIKYFVDKMFHFYLSTSLQHCGTGVHDMWSAGPCQLLGCCLLVWAALHDLVTLKHSFTKKQACPEVSFCTPQRKKGITWMIWCVSLKSIAFGSLRWEVWDVCFLHGELTNPGGLVISSQVCVITSTMLWCHHIPITASQMAWLFHGPSLHKDYIAVKMKCRKR